MAFFDTIRPDRSCFASPWHASLSRLVARPRLTDEERANLNSYYRQTRPAAIVTASLGGHP